MRKYRIWVGLAVAALLGLTTVIVVQLDGEIKTQEQDASLEAAVHSLETQFFDRRRPELEWLASLPQVRSLLAHPSPVSPRVSEELARAAGLLDLETVFLITAAGIVAAADDETFVGLDVSTRTYFRKSMSGLPAYGLITDSASRMHDLYASVPVYDQGSIVGVAAFRTSASTFDRWQRGYMGLLIVGPDNRVFSSRDPRFQEGIPWTGALESRVEQGGKWYSVRRAPLSAVPGFTLVSMKRERWPWEFVLVADVLLLLIVATTALVLNQRRVASLRREEERDRKQRELLLSHLLEGIALFGGDGRLVWANPAFERLLQRSSTDTPSMAQLWHSTDGPWVDVLDGSRSSVVFESILKGGPEGWTPVSAGFVAAEGGFLLSVLDGTERYRSEQLLAQSQKLTVLGQLSGGIAHDLNNMLGVLMGMADLLKMSLSERDPLQESVELILSTLGRAAGLSEKMLNFARKTPIQRVRFDLTVLLRELRFLSGTALPEGTAVEVELPPQPLFVEGDENLLLSALLNLILNACEALPNGGTVKLSCAVEGKKLIIRVEDNGVGMDAVTQARIFEPFFSTKQGKGTGLGLSLVRRTVLEHRGSIEVRSIPGKGTTVNVTLPVV